jgi:hypothetical protein
VLFGPEQKFFEMVAHEAVQVGKFRIAAAVGVSVLASGAEGHADGADQGSGQRRAAAIAGDFGSTQVAARHRHAGVAGLQMRREAADQGANGASGEAPGQMAERHELVASVHLVD